MDDQQARCSFTSAAEVCALLPLGDEARELLRPEAPPNDYLSVLDERRLHVDAIRFLGLYLPARKAVWWACACARYASESLPRPEEAALRAGVRWVLEPSRERVEDAKVALEKAGSNSPAWAITLAVARSAKRPVAAGKAAAGAVLMAAARVKGESLSQVYALFFALGLTVERLATPWQSTDH